jgi:uncharacterized membrane protein YgdD (TMEM256/DUF423 family)
MPWYMGAAGVLGFLAVGLGAFGAHALRLEGPAAGWFETANQYHFYHALALLALAFGARSGVESDALWWQLAAWSWFVGVLIFSGTLYAMALGAPRWFGAITPIGGLALMLGWLAVMILWFRSAN